MVSTMAVAVIFFPFLNELGNLKLFELCLIFHHGTTMATVTIFLQIVLHIAPCQRLWRRGDRDDRTPKGDKNISKPPNISK